MPYLADGQKLTPEFLEEFYGDTEVAKTIFDSAKENGTIEAIEQGRCTIPLKHDAQVFHESRIMKQEGFSDAEIHLLHSSPVVRSLLSKLAGKE